jgi:hypothetical protein
MKSALKLGALMLAAAAGAAVLAPMPSAQAADNGRAAPAAFKEIRWDELVPKDWDPYKRFRDKKLDGLTDNDPRSEAMLKEMREVWDAAPTNPLMNGARVRLAGYIVPLEEAKGELKEFLLVPYFGACIHTPPPPANQIIHVLPAQPLKGFKGMVPVWVNGTIKTQRDDSMMGVSGYHIDAVKVEHYEMPKQ